MTDVTGQLRNESSAVTPLFFKYIRAKCDSIRTSAHVKVVSRRTPEHGSRRDEERRVVHCHEQRSPITMQY